MLCGVLVGVAVGELAKVVIGSGWLQVGAAVVVGMLERLAGLEYVHAGAVLLARTAAEVTDRGDDVPADLVDGVADLAAVVRALAEHPRDADPASGPGCPRDAHAVAATLALTDPDARPPGAARLATQLHLLAEDVDALTVSSRAGAVD